MVIKDIGKNKPATTQQVVDAVVARVDGAELRFTPNHGQLLGVGRALGNINGVVIGSRRAAVLAGVVGARRALGEDCAAERAALRALAVGGDTAGVIARLATALVDDVDVDAVVASAAARESAQERDVLAQTAAVLDRVDVVDRLLAAGAMAAGSAPVARRACVARAGGAVDGPLMAAELLDVRAERTLSVLCQAAAFGTRQDVIHRALADRTVREALLVACDAHSPGVLAAARAASGDVDGARAALRQPARNDWEVAAALMLGDVVTRPGPGALGVVARLAGATPALRGVVAAALVTRSDAHDLERLWLNAARAALVDDAASAFADVIAGLGTTDDHRDVCERIIVPGAIARGCLALAAKAAGKTKHASTRLLGDVAAAFVVAGDNGGAVGCAAALSKNLLVSSVGDFVWPLAEALALAPTPSAQPLR